MQDAINTYRNAIAAIESAGSGGYSALGPDTGKGRAYGRYQVMDFNIGPWTKEVLGREFTPQEFLSSEQAQDAVFNAKFGQSVQKYGNPQDAASIWFTGKPAAQGGNRTDVLGTSGNQYVAKFNQAMGQPQVTREKPMQEGLLGQFGNQPGSGQKDLPFYQRDKFRDIAGGIASAANSLRHRPDPNLDARLAQAKQARTQQQQTNKTVQWLQAQGRTDLAEAVGSGAMDPREAVGIMYRKDAGAEYGLTPQYITDADGKLKMIQLSKDGTAKEVELPEGAAIQKGVEKLDLGTHFQWHNTITGEPIGEPIPKNNRQAAADTAAGGIEGKTQAEAAINLPTITAKSESALSLIDDIIKDPALPSITGMIQGRMPPLSQGGTDLNAKINQLKGKVFMEAYESLKGGGVITEIEGMKAEAAIARLERAQSTEEYIAAMTDLKEVISGGMAVAKRKAGQSSAPTSSTSNDPLGIR